MYSIQAVVCYRAIEGICVLEEMQVVYILQALVYHRALEGLCVLEEMQVVHILQALCRQTSLPTSIKLMNIYETLSLIVTLSSR